MGAALWYKQGEKIESVPHLRHGCQRMERRGPRPVFRAKRGAPPRVRDGCTGQTGNERAWNTVTSEELRRAYTQIMYRHHDNTAMLGSL